MTSRVMADKVMTNKVMTDKNDILIKQFMQTHKQDIPDDGFTERVMRNLPADSPIVMSNRWTILCCGLMAVVVLVLLWTGHLSVTLRMPDVIGSLLRDLQSPHNITQFLVGHLRNGLLLWLALLAAAFKFAYEQFKSV